MWNRRVFVAAASSALALPARPGALAEGNRFASIEKERGGVLGVFALDTGSGRTVGWRADECFPLCSSFKFLLAALVLQRVDQHLEHLERLVSFDKRDLLAHSPISSSHLAEGHMSVDAMCEAAVTESDNGAANLLLKSVGGPPVVTAFVRSLGDPTTRLDRFEMALNDVAPGDVRDTTSPSAMVANMRKLTLGSTLSERSRAQLIAWLKGCRTGSMRLRAGLPSDWIVGDKTGTGFRAETNDVAIAWPPKKAPIIIAAYYKWSPAPAAARDRVLADVAQIVARQLS